MIEIKEGYKKTEIGVIPVEWEVVELGDILTIQRGASPRPINEFITENEDGVNWIKIGDIKKNDKYIVKTKQKITDDGAKKSRAIKPKDFVLSNSMSFGRPYISRIYGCIHDGWLLLRNKNENNLSNNYLYEILSGDLAKRQFKRFSAGSTVNNLKSETVSTLKIPLPPLKEQKEIANILSTADKKIEAIDLQIQKAQTLKKGLLQKLLSEGIGHSEFKDSELGRIPENWEVVELDTVAKLNKQKYTPIQSENLHYIGLEHINQEQGTINGVGCSTDTLSQKNCFNKGEILFGKLRPYLRKFYLADIDGVCSTEILVIKAKGNILNSILFQIITTESFIEHSISKVFGTKMPRTSWAILKEFKLALPPLKEQKQIAQILSTADKKLELLRAKKEKYETLKKGLLQKLLSGEVRVGCCP